MGLPVLGNGIHLVGLVSLLLPTAVQSSIILETMRRCNQAANEIAIVAQEMRHRNSVHLAALLYEDLRRRYDLPANLVLHAISKVVHELRPEANGQPFYAPDSTLFYLQGRSLTWKGPDRVSLLTVEGRQLLPVRFSHYTEEDTGKSTMKRGNALLAHQDGLFSLLQMVEAPVLTPANLVSFPVRHLASGS